MRRLNKLKGMYALLIAVVALIGITIYGSCSADEDYGDYYYSGNELSTRAERIMERGNEGNGNSLPSVETIKNNSLVVAKMDTAWGMTMDRLQINFQRVEHGFFIYYNPSNGTFDCSKICSGTPIACGQDDKTFTLPELPIPSGYVLCGLFHTHTSLRWCTDISRQTGLSDGDIDMSNSLHVPILLYDYSVPIIFAGESESMPHKIYSHDPNEE